LLAINNTLALLSVQSAFLKFFALGWVAAFGCSFLNESNVSFRELLNNKLIHKLFLSLVETMVDVVGLLKRDRIRLKYGWLKLRPELLQVNVLVLVAVEALHFWMKLLSMLQNLEDLVDVETCLDCV